MKKIIFILTLLISIPAFAGNEEVLYADNYIKVTLLNYKTHYCNSEDIVRGCRITIKDDIVTLYNAPVINDIKSTFKWHVSRIREMEYN